MARVYRLTESNLRAMVERAVRGCLSEGQGWNKFRDIVRRSNDDRIHMDASLDDMANYVRTGTDTPGELESGSGNYSAVYDEDGDGMSSLGNAGRAVNTSWRGKVGRAAGLGAGIGYHYGRKGLKAAGKAVSDAVKGGMRSLERRRLRRRRGSDRPYE